MNILLNELSLDGQFADLEEFENNLIKDILPVLKEIDALSFSLIKKSEFYNRMTTSDETIYDILKKRQIDSIRKFKGLLSNMLTDKPPFWDNDQQHNDSDRYFYQNRIVNNTSLAEAAERDRIVLSFKHKDFIERTLKILKNDLYINIDNITKAEPFFDIIRNRKILSFETFIKKRFAGTNLDFSEIDSNLGFNLIQSSDENVFLKTFEKFANMQWNDILQDNGLNYKEFRDNNNRFNHINYSIYKFRVTQKYRCFGYRKEDAFFVVRFETDHKLSDKG